MFVRRQLFHDFAFDWMNDSFIHSFIHSSVTYSISQPVIDSISLTVFPRGCAMYMCMCVCGGVYIYIYIHVLSCHKTLSKTRLWWLQSSWQASWQCYLQISTHPCHSTGDGWRADTSWSWERDIVTDVQPLWGLMKQEAGPVSRKSRRRVNVTGCEGWARCHGDLCHVTAIEIHRLVTTYLLMTWPWQLYTGDGTHQ